MGVNLLQAVTNNFLQAGGNQVTDPPKVVSNHTQGDQGMETCPPSDSLALCSPPVGDCICSFKRDWKCSNNVLNIITNGLRSTILHKTKISQSSPDSLRIQGPSKRSSSGLLHPVSSVKERNRKGGMCKIWVSLIDLSDAYLHIPHPPSLNKVSTVLPRFSSVQFTFIPFGLSMALQDFTTIVNEVKLMALTRGVRLHQYPDDYLLRAPVQEEAQSNTQTAVDLTQSFGWRRSPNSKPCTRVF